MNNLEVVERRALSRFDERIIGTGECRDILGDLLPILRKRAAGDLTKYQRDLEHACYIVRELQEIFLLVYWQPEVGGLRYSMYAWPNPVIVMNSGYNGTNPDAYERLIDALANYLRYPWLRHDAIDASAISAILLAELSAVAPGNAASAFIRWASGTLRKSRTDAMSEAWKASLGSTIHPSELKQRVTAAERQGASYPPILHALIDRATARGPHATIRTGSMFADDKHS
jgi:hypothetical protein